MEENTDFKKRYNTVTKALEDLQEKYLLLLEENRTLNRKLEGAEKLNSARENTLQLFANERNEQERRHAEQVEELMVRIRSLKGQLDNGNFDNVGD